VSLAAVASGLPQLAKYELLEEIGHGGMATVYRARDVRLGREVAIKIIHKHLRENAEVGTRFIAEARAAAKLHHPGIVEVFDVSGEDDSERYLVVELLRGATLRKVLVDHRDMPAEVGAAIVLELCEAVAHAHEAAIIHRDIKPENVLVELPEDRALANARGAAEAAETEPERPLLQAVPTPSSSRRDGRAPANAPANANEPSDTQQSQRDALLDGETGPRRRSDAAEGAESSERAEKSERNRAREREREIAKKARAEGLGVIIKLTDFGIAKILDAQGVTSTGQVLGSPAHMAPEQIEGGDVDVRTDVFGLGVLMYECLVGHLPFEGKNPAQVLRKVLEGLYAAVDRERPTTGGRWGRIVAHALARDAEARTASPGALAQEIRAELTALGISDPKAEILAYFTDTRGYADALPARLVPRLVARGEAARKAGDVPGAAADFNRALALAPSDLAILKRIGRLTSSAGRRLMLKRGAMILGGSALLGLLAFGVARGLRARHARLDAEAAASAAVLAAGPASATPAISAEPRAHDNPTIKTGPTASAVVRPILRLLPPMPPSAAPVPAGDRSVRFVLNPPGAKLTVDGREVNWFSTTVALAPGPHAVGAFMANSKCCKAINGASVTVTPAPADNPGAAQTIALSLEVLPATTSLSGAPANGQYFCPGINVSGFAGGPPQKAKLPEPMWSGKCQFTASADKPPRPANVTLKAGELNVIPWPAE
jgi:eukaryotic-like serine/threonine-protein kinase